MSGSRLIWRIGMSNVNTVKSISRDALEELEIVQQNLNQVGKILDDINNWVQESKRKDEELA